MYIIQDFIVFLKDKQHPWFQQDGALGHFAGNSLKFYIQFIGKNYFDGNIVLLLEAKTCPSQTPFCGNLTKF